MKTLLATVSLVLCYALSASAATLSPTSDWWLILAGSCRATQESSDMHIQVGCATSGPARGYIRFETSTLPAQLDHATLRLYALAGNSDIVDVTAHDGATSAPFDIYMLERGYAYVGQMSVVGDGFCEVDVTETIQTLRDAGATSVTFRLSLPIETNKHKTFAGIRETTYPHPVLVYEEAVPAAQKSLGQIKGMFR